LVDIAKREKLRKEWLKVYDGEKMIEFTWPAERQSQIKRVDVLAD